MAHEKNHDYHILTPSIQPFLGAIAAFIMLFGAVLWFHDSGPWMFLIGFALILLAILLTGLYVTRANRDYDAALAALRAEYDA